MHHDNRAPIQAGTGVRGIDDRRARPAGLRRQRVHTPAATTTCRVGTVYGPYWYPDRYNSFTVVRYPWYGDPPPPPANDPRHMGSVTQRAIAEQIREDFAGRGYRHLESDGDVDVAVYASSEKELNISGYTHDYNWKNLPKLRTKTEYPKGTVIVDVLAPKTHELLWRGETVAPVSTRRRTSTRRICAHAVNRVVAKYPKAKS